MNSQRINGFVAYLLPTDTGKSVGGGVEACAFLPRAIQSAESWLIEMPHETVGYLSIHYKGGGTISYRAGESRDEALGMTFDHVEHSSEFPQVEACLLPTGKSSWRSNKRFVMRWCKITAASTGGPLEVMAIAIKTTGHSVNEVGGFSCSDSKVNEMYGTGVRTVRLCMQEVYEDGVRRDKLPWIFDTIPQALVNYYTYGDRDLFRASWRHFAREYPGHGIVCTSQLWGPYGSFPVERPRHANGSFGPTPGQAGSPVHNDCVWPVVNFYQVEALFAWNLPQAWELLQRCWGNMIDQVN
ncbi:MAG: hypothetical protein RRC34_07410 [Lentisphaeria bacterium]|nr:hypothetical protein [Lentisphaeria bacterium]